MTITPEAVLKALSYVEEPDLGQDLVTLNMIENIEITGRTVAFTVVLTTPACPLKQLIHDACERAIHTMVDKEANVVITMTARVTTLRNNRGDLLPGVKNIIAIASGKGGVGKSTVAANLAVALAATGARVGLVDADISGPSMPVMFDVENQAPHVFQGPNGKNLIQPIEKYGVKLMSIGFLAPAESAIVWRGPMASSALKQFITEVDWGELDYLLLDLPPGTSDIHLTLVQTVPVTGAVIVTTPQKVALADAQKGLQMFRQPQINVPVLGVVENMAWFTPAELPEQVFYFWRKRWPRAGRPPRRAVAGPAAAGAEHPRKRRPGPAGRARPRIDGGQALCRPGRGRGPASKYPQQRGPKNGRRADEILTHPWKT